MKGARVTAAAVPGCQHVVTGNGAPCQDAARTLIDDNCVIIAVSDGHGDAQYTHSDEGARIAANVAIDVLKLASEQLSSPNPEHDLATWIKRRILFEWNRHVKHHARMVAARDGTALLWPDEVTGDWDEKVKPYGATLVSALATNTHLVWLRLGDGDALNMSKRMFAAADKSMGQATYSLSMRSAIEHMDVVIEPRANEEQQLIVLATDGVTDQYDADPSFEEEWGTKMLLRITAKGWTEVVMDLPRHLGTVARDGDDCAVAMMWLPA